MPRRIPTYRPPGSALARAAGRRDYDRSRRDREGKRFYDSAAWLKLRRVKLALAPLCERCESRGLVVVADQVHHRRERRDRPDLALDLDNLESLCRPCHNSARRDAPSPGEGGG